MQFKPCAACFAHSLMQQRMIRTSSVGDCQRQSYALSPYFRLQHRSGGATVVRIQRPSQVLQVVRTEQRLNVMLSF